MGWGGDGTESVSAGVPNTNPLLLKSCTGHNTVQSLLLSLNIVETISSFPVVI